MGKHLSYTETVPLQAWLGPHGGTMDAEINVPSAEKPGASKGNL